MCKLLNLLTGEPGNQPDFMVKALRSIQKTAEELEQAMADMKTATAMEIRDLGYQILDSTITTKAHTTPKPNQTYTGATKMTKATPQTLENQHQQTS